MNTCCDPACGARAVWVRHTQFSGDHPFCDLHAKAESNFGHSSSYYDWKQIDHAEVAKAVTPTDVAQQTIVVRKDLAMARGKIGAQVGHSVMMDLLKLWQAGVRPDQLVGAANDYYNIKFTKIVLAVKDEAELNEIYTNAKAAGLTTHMVIDSGFTEFHNVPTKTCVCIGPHYKSQIDPITKHLKLYN